jgi:hypothetical protein
MNASINQREPAKTLFILQIVAGGFPVLDAQNRARNLTGLSSGALLKRKKPRQIADEACSIFLPDIKSDSRYGLSPIVPFQFWAEVRVFKPGLGSASGEARHSFRWSFFHSRTLL